MLWPLLWLAGFLFFVLYPKAISFYILLLLLFLPLFSFLLLLLARRNSRISFSSKTSELGPEDSSANMTFVFQRASRLPIAKMRMWIQAANAFTGETAEETVEISLSGRNVSLSIPISSPHCGKLTLRIKKAVLMDFTRLFSLSVSCPGEESLFVYPSIPEFLLAGDAPAPLEDAEAPTDHRRGTDFSELFGLHSFQEGDRFRDIHWKLSARTDDWIVKEGSVPEQRPVRIYLQLCGSFSELDALLSTVCALCRNLFQKNAVVELLFWNETAHSFERILLNAFPEWMEWLKSLLSAPASSEPHLLLAPPKGLSASPYSLYFSGTFGDAEPETAFSSYEGEKKRFPLLPGMEPGKASLFFFSDSEPEPDFFSALQSAGIFYCWLDPASLDAEGSLRFSRPASPLNRSDPHIQPGPHA